MIQAVTPTRRRIVGATAALAVLSALGTGCGSPPTTHYYGERPRSRCSRAGLGRAAGSYPGADRPAAMGGSQARRQPCRPRAGALDRTPWRRNPQRGGRTSDPVLRTAARAGVSSGRPAMAHPHRRSTLRLDAQPRRPTRSRLVASRRRGCHQLPRQLLESGYRARLRRPCTGAAAGDPATRRCCRRGASRGEQRSSGYVLTAGRAARVQSGEPRAVRRPSGIGPWFVG